MECEEVDGLGDGGGKLLEKDSLVPSQRHTMDEVRG